MTEDIEHWSEYPDVVSGIMKSVSADEPDGDSKPAADDPDAGGTESQA